MNTIPQFVSIISRAAAPVPTAIFCTVKSHKIQICTYVCVDHFLLEGGVLEALNVRSAMISNVLILKSRELVLEVFHVSWHIQ